MSWRSDPYHNRVINCVAWLLVCWVGIYFLVNWYIDTHIGREEPPYAVASATCLGPGYCTVCEKAKDTGFMRCDIRWDDFCPIPCVSDAWLDAEKPLARPAALPWWRVWP